MGNDLNYNALFDQKILDILYARDLFKMTTESSFSNARAMQQLRQFYMRMVDNQDLMECVKHWEF